MLCVSVCIYDFVLFVLFICMPLRICIMPVARHGPTRAVQGATIVEHGGALVESIASNRRVVSSVHSNVNAIML